MTHPSTRQISSTQWEIRHLLDTPTGPSALWLPLRVRPDGLEIGAAGAWISWAALDQARRAGAPEPEPEARGRTPDARPPREPATREAAGVMPRRRAWEPDWVVPPAEMLREWMEDAGLTPRLLALACHPLRAGAIEDVLAKKPFGRDVAEALGRGTQVDADFWLALEQNYRAGLARGIVELGDGDAS